MSVYFHEHLRSYDGVIRGSQPLTAEMFEQSAAHAFKEVLSQKDIKEADKDALLEEIRTEGVLFGIDNERVKELYLEALSQQVEKV